MDRCFIILAGATTVIMYRTAILTAQCIILPGCVLGSAIYLTSRRIKKHKYSAYCAIIQEDHQEEMNKYIDSGIFNILCNKPPFDAYEKYNGDIGKLVRNKLTEENN